LTSVPRPGSDAEHFLQDLYGTRERADRFYREQLLDCLTPRMMAFLGRQTQMIIATTDVEGHPDASVRFGEPGFVSVLDERSIAWPELRGNGVMTSLGNIAKNPWTHVMFLDPGERIGLHVRGQSTIVEPDVMAEDFPEVVNRPPTGSRPPDRWVLLRLTHSYVHCRKHFPRAEETLPRVEEVFARSDEGLIPGFDEVKAKGGDYFGAKETPAPWSPAADSPDGHLAHQHRKPRGRSWFGRKG